MALMDVRSAQVRPVAEGGVRAMFVGAFDEFPGPSEILRVLRRHKLLIAGIVLPLTLLAGLYGTLAPERYTATAMMALDPKEAPLPNLGTIPGQLIRDMPILETQLHVILSPAILGEVADRLELASNPGFIDPPSVKARLVALLSEQAAPLMDRLEELRQLLRAGPDEPAEQMTRDEIIERLADDISVQQVGESYAMTLSYQAADPVLAAAVVNETARTYIRYQLDSKLRSAGGTGSYLEVRLAELREEVERADSQLETYRAENALPVDGTEEVLSRRIADLNLELIDTRSQIAVTEARVRALQELQASGDPVALARALDSQTADQLALEVASLARRRSELLLSYGPEHPSVQALRADESALRRTIREEADRGLAAVVRDLDLLRVKAEEIGNEITAAQDQIARDQHAMVRIASLKRDADVNRRLYEEMLTQRKLLAEQRSLVQPDVELVAEASPDLESGAPPFLFYPIIGFIGSGALATLLALVRDRTDPRVRSARQVERLTRRPVVARLPSVPRRGRQRPEAHVAKNPNGAYAEMLRHIYRDLEAERPDRESLVALVTSAAPGEGKSSTVSGLAGLLRRSGKRVAVVDLDLRRPRLARLFDQGDLGPAVNDLLALPPEGWERDMAGALARPFLVLPARAAGDEVLPLLESRQLAATLRALRLHYDFVLIDTPPVLPTSDAMFLGRFADAVLVVCRWLKTEVSAVREACERMAQRPAPSLLGIVVNRIDPSGYGNYAQSYGEQVPLEGSYPYGSKG
jgi:succinoglycan biosynthesis transport protein ExoP